MNYADLTENYKCKEIEIKKQHRMHHIDKYIPFILLV